MIIRVKKTNRRFDRRLSEAPRRGKGANQMNTHNQHDISLPRRGRTGGRDRSRPITDRLAVRTLSSEALFQGEHEIGIEHAVRSTG